MEKKSTFEGNANSEYDSSARSSRIPLFNSQASISIQAKSKSNLNTTRSVAQKPKPAFRSGGSNTAQNTTKKTYQKNSDKTIKPPDKLNRLNSDVSERRSNASSILEGKQESMTSVSSRNRSCGDSFPLAEIAAPFARIDTKTITDLEKRVENLQSIFLKKVEMYRNRSPEQAHKEYKFIALVTGDESKLLVKENDRKSFPTFLPAKSVEDLNRKTSEFFIACLLSFMDKLRCYQDEGRAINVEEIYDELRAEEQEYCGILQDWITDLCDDEDKTLVISDHSELDFLHKDTQTEVEKEAPKMLVEREMQTDNVPMENNTVKYNEVCGKIDKLRLENYELKEQLANQKENHDQEIEILERRYKDKISDLMDSWQKEKCELSEREEVLIKEQRMNTDLSQQAIELKNRLKDLMLKHDTLLTQKREDDRAHLELKKAQIELQRLEKENSHLQESRNHFLKRLDQRYEQIELQEKEIKMQKKEIQAKNDEIQNLKKQYEAKIKENRHVKESLEARNKLIDHLRNAVEIDQRKIRELELLLQSKQKNADDATEIEMVKSKATANSQEPKSLRLRTSYLDQAARGVKRGPNIRDDLRLSSYSAPFVENDLFVKFDPTGVEETRVQQKRSDREKEKKKDLNLNKKETIYDFKAFQAEILSENSLEGGKTQTRSVKQNKRNRDIVVRKYDV